MPAFTTGRSIARVWPAAPDELLLKYAGTDRPVAWSQQANVFARAREAGFNSAVIGWSLPYCRIINRSLTTCYWYPLKTIRSDAGQGLLASMANLLQGLSLSWQRLPHRTAYLRIREHARNAAIDPALGLILVHWPIPHIPVIYDRQTARLTLTNLAYPDGYFDNLALVDRSLGELRQAMEGAGLWDKTTVLVTSDHAWRDAARFDGQVDHRVPFLLKMPGQKDRITYRRVFNAVLTHDLILAILRRRLAGPAGVVRWLDEHAAMTRNPYPADEYPSPDQGIPL